MKRFLSLFLALVMALALAAPAFAAEPDDGVFASADHPSMGIELYGIDENGEQIFQDPVIVSEPFIDPALVGTTNPDGIMPLDDYGLIPHLREQFDTEKKEPVRVTPAQQPPLGYKGGSGATVFFFSTGGSSVTFEVTIKSKIVSFKAETGVTASYGSGYGAQVPADAGNYKFNFLKYYVITTKIFDYYQGGQYKYSIEVHDPKYSLGHEWKNI